MVGSKDEWFCVPELVNSNSVVLSGGAGLEITFEHELSERHGCTVHLFDPSPTGLRLMEQEENQREKIIYHPIGMAGATGKVTFGLPRNPQEGSYRTAAAIGEESDKGVTFDCVALSDFCSEHGFKHIDLLKIDIEGFEYEVLEDLAQNDITIGQICVEYHNFHDGHSNWETISSISSLYRKGYRLVHKRRHDYLFVNVEYVRQNFAGFFSEVPTR